MGFTSYPNSMSSVVCSNTKAIAHEAALQQSFISFTDLVADIEQLQTDSENYRVQYLSLKEKCENKTCSGVEELKKAVAAKDRIIQSVASILTRLNETRNFNMIAEAFKILCEETTPLTPPIDDKQSPTTSTMPNTANVQCASIDYDDVISHHAEKSLENISIKEESVCEIEGTPTGRTSPILNTRKTKNSFIKSSDFRDKKKCPDDWPTPETKSIKLIFPTPSRKSGTGGKLKQTRLHLVKPKITTVVDLTCPDLALKNEPCVQPLIKKESIENDDTILPSPTSGPTNFTLFKTTSKPSPSKFKKPLSLKIKTESSPVQDENKDITKHTTNVDMNESINILNQLPTRLKNGTKQESPIKIEPIEDDDVTNCEILSMILQIDKLEAEHMKENCSPAKRPLSTNINIVNTPPKDAESSMSILRPDPGLKAAVENVKRQIPELVEPIYKEPTVRNKAEKRALQGWSCEECKNFYGELYKNDPVMLAKKINECSKHRGRHNPARPKTPPNFWNPRWHVPDNTEELNRLNNAS